MNISFIDAYFGGDVVGRGRETLSNGKRPPAGHIARVKVNFWKKRFKVILWQRFISPKILSATWIPNSLKISAKWIFGGINRCPVYRLIFKNVFGLEELKSAA